MSITEVPASAIADRIAPQHVSGPSEMGLIDAIANWCECLQGRVPLLSALKQLSESLGAKAVCLSRHSREPNGPVRSVIFNSPLHAGASPEVTRSYAHCVLGRYVDRPRPASVWFSSLSEWHDDPALEVFQKRARIAETVVVALALEDKWADYIEIHFGSQLNGNAQTLFNALADTLSRTWTRRSPGLFSDAMLANQKAVPRSREPLLSTSNPARLTRAEFRICVLLSRGLNTASVCSELSISPSTLKAHLRSIFAKTETSSMAELLFQLLAPWQGESRTAGMPQRWRA